MKVSAPIKAALAAALLFLFVGCDSPISNPSDVLNDTSSIENLRVPSDFNWRTDHVVSVSLEGYELSSVRITTDEGDLLHRAILHPGTTYTVTLSLPAHQQNVIVHYRGQQRKFAVHASAISHTFTRQAS